MRGLQWQLLPLLLLWLLFLHMLQAGPSPSQQQRAVEALLTFKRAIGDPIELSSWVGDPCLRVWRGVYCSGPLWNRAVTDLRLSKLQLKGPLSPALQNLTNLVTLWLDNNHFRGCIPTGLGQLKNLTSLRLSDNFLNGSIPSSLAKLPKLKELILVNNQLSGPLPFDEDTLANINVLVNGNPLLCSATGCLNLSLCLLVWAPVPTGDKHVESFTNKHGSQRHVIMLEEGGPASAPVLVISPPVPNTEKSKSGANVGAIAGGVVGAVVLVSITITLVSLSLFRAKSCSSGHSDTGSSDPSAQVDWVKGPDSPSGGGVPPTASEVHRARQFTLAELETATKQWSPNNLIGEGGFGLVYKGLLEDGTIVAIKKRTYSANQEFSNEVDYLSSIRHRHLVILLGYCQENDQQMLVYDYLPNGSISNHLYDSEGNSLGKLDFKQRISIALGAAKGLERLHSLTPALVHKDFKTSNVLVDENFVSKVTDYGLSRLLTSGQDLLPSPNGAGTAGFLDPEFFVLQRLSEKSDVYSFGVFLLELISGREAISTNRPRPEWSLVEWAQSLLEKRDLGALVDSSLAGNFTEEGIKSVMEVSFQCIESVGDKRPTMNEIVKELDQILEKERGFAPGIEGTANVTLGSELFA